MTNATKEVRDDFVRLWGSLGTFWGVSPTTARVFGWLFSRSEGADAEEIMEALELSRGAVSMACRELRDWGLLTTERGPGSRRTLYSSERDLEKVVRHVVQIRKQREWDPIIENLEAWLPRLESESGEDAEFLAQRLRAVEELVDLADSLVERLLKGGTVTNFGLKVLVGGAERRSRKARRAATSEAFATVGDTTTDAPDQGNSEPRNEREEDAVAQTADQG